MHRFGRSGSRARMPGSRRLIRCRDRQPVVPNSACGHIPRGSMEARTLRKVIAVVPELRSEGHSRSRHYSSSLISDEALRVGHDEVSPWSPISAIFGQRRIYGESPSVRFKASAGSCKHFAYSHCRGLDFLHSGHPQVYRPHDGGGSFHANWISASLLHCALCWCVRDCLRSPRFCWGCRRGQRQSL